MFFYSCFTIDSKSSVSNRDQVKPIEVELYSATCEPSFLRELYELKYSESHYTWPRRFNLDIKDLVSSRLQSQHPDRAFDVIVWLTFREMRPVNSSLTRYKVTLCSNLKLTKLEFDNINTNRSWELHELVDKVVTLLSDLLPVESFVIKQATIKPQNQTGLDLPNIAKRGNSNLDIERLKIDLIHGRNNLLSANKCYHRLNSFEVVKQELSTQKSVEELTAEEKFNQISRSAGDGIEFSQECVLCFDSIKSVAECVILKPCASCICNQCMKDYVQSSLLSGKTKLSCPCGLNSDPELELALIINYAGSLGQLMDTFIRRSVEQITFVLNDYKVI